VGSDPAVVAQGASQRQRRSSEDTRSSGADRNSVCAQKWDSVGDVTTRTWMWFGNDLLEAVAAMAPSRCVAQAASSVAGSLGTSRPDRLVPSKFGFTKCACSRGGEKTGKNPTDRGKSGTKRHVLVEREGIPLAVTLSGANVHDNQQLEATLDAVDPIRRPRGRPRKRPQKLHADKGYDAAWCRQACRKRGIIPRIARRGIESSQRLGTHRWVVERTLSWLNRYRRLKVRYERRADIHQAFVELGCALIVWNFFERFC